MDFQAVPWNEYRPGLWEQDVFSIPIQGALLGAVSLFYSKDREPLWPFMNEYDTRERSSTRHPKQLLSLVGFAGTSAAFGYFQIKKDNFEVYSFLSGLAHTHLLTELVTLSAKNAFQRKRPFYDYELTQKKKLGQNVQMDDDDRKSFFSGHASHSMAWANYTGLLLRRELNYSLSSYVMSGGLWALAGYVGAARAIDGQHYWSDVLVGSAVGFAVSSFVFNSVQETILFKDGQRTTHLSASPVWVDKQMGFVMSYGLNL